MLWAACSASTQEAEGMNVYLIDSASAQRDVREGEMLDSHWERNNDWSLLMNVKCVKKRRGMLQKYGDGLIFHYPRASSSSYVERSLYRERSWWKKKSQMCLRECGIWEREIKWQLTCTTTCCSRRSQGLIVSFTICCYTLHLLYCLYIPSTFSTSFPFLQRFTLENRSVISLYFILYSL